MRRWDERVPHEFGFTQSLFNFYERPLSEELWDAQVRAIREIADKESCVIVGRNADYILREFDHCLRVFVHADRNWRLLHMRKLMPDTPFDQLEVDMDKADRARKNYCVKHTGRVYGDSRNYDLTLCTSKLGIDKALEILLCAAKDIWDLSGSGEGYLPLFLHFYAENHTFFCKKSKRLNFINLITRIRLDF